MATNRQVSVIFKRNNQNYVTSLDNRSRNKFIDLITKYGGATFDVPTEGESYQFIALQTVLKEIEDKYQNFENTIAEKITKQVNMRVDRIKILNDIKINKPAPYIQQITTDSENDDEQNEDEQ